MPASIRRSSWRTCAARRPSGSSACKTCCDSWIRCAVLDALKLLETLHATGVRFVIIGGIAMVLRGSSRVTVDLDICYARDAANLDKLASALAPFHPRLRGAPPELPFLWD